MIIAVIMPFEQRSVTTVIAHGIVLNSGHEVNVNISVIFFF